MTEQLAISPPYNTFNNVGIMANGRWVASRHANFITNGTLFQCLDCGRWSDSLNVLNAVDCEEVEGKTLEQLRA